MYCSIGLYGRSLWQVMRRGAKVAIKQLLKYGRHPPMHDPHLHCHLRLHYLQHMIIMTKFCFMFIVIIITVFTINIIVLYRLQIGCESCKLMLEGAGLGGWEATLGFFFLSSSASSSSSSSSSSCSSSSSLSSSSSPCHHHLLLLYHNHHFHHLLHNLLHHHNHDDHLFPIGKHRQATEGKCWKTIGILLRRISEGSYLDYHIINAMIMIRGHP